MKKVVLYFCALFALARGYALPVVFPFNPGIYNCCCPEVCESGLSSWCDYFSFGGGFYGDYVFNRYMQVKDSGRKVERTRINTNSGLLFLDICKRVELFATLGTTHITLETPRIAFVFGPTSFNEIFTLESETHFSWSAGLNAALIQWCGWTINSEVHYFSSHPQVNYLLVQGGPSIYPSEHLRYREIQVATGISRCFSIINGNSFIAPYAAIKWSHARINMPFSVFVVDPTTGEAISLRNLRNKKHVGAAVGLTLAGCKAWSLTVEGCFGDELAVHFNGQLRF